MQQQEARVLTGRSSEEAAFCLAPKLPSTSRRADREASSAPQLSCPLLSPAPEQASLSPTDIHLHSNVDMLLKYSYALSSQKPLARKLPLALPVVPRPSGDRGLPEPTPTLLVPAPLAPSPPYSQAERAWQRRLQHSVRQLIGLALTLETSAGTEDSTPDPDTVSDLRSVPSGAEEGMQEEASRGR